MEVLDILMKFMLLFMGSIIAIYLAKITVWYFNWLGYYSHGDIIIHAETGKKWYVFSKYTAEKVLAGYGSWTTSKLICYGLDYDDKIIKKHIPLDEVFRFKRASFKEFKSSKGQILNFIVSDKFKDWAKENLK